MTFEGDVFDHDFLETSGFALYTMELAADGTGWIKIDGKATITWGDGKITVNESNAVYTYTYKDGMIVLEESTGESMTFKKTDSADASSGLKQVGEDGSGAELTAHQQYWSGDWYGWIAYSNGTNNYASLDGFYMDCMARIEVDENGEGTVLLWDEATSVGDPRANVSIQISDGGFEQGRLKSVSGLFSDGDVGNADWLVDPDGLGYENLICIEGSYKDPDDFFSGYDYTIYLRPWGLDWADIETDQPDGLPDHYDWYSSPCPKA